MLQISQSVHPLHLRKKEVHVVNSAKPHANPLDMNASSNLIASPKK